jgi:glycosyltransferase involved in cell wall biosynthesis
LKNTILIILPRPPFPLESGGDHAQFHFINALSSKLDISVSFEVTPANFKSFKESELILKNVKFYPYLNFPHLNKALKTYRSFKAFSVKIKKQLLFWTQLKKKDDTDFIKYYSFINLPIFPQNRGFANHIARICNDKIFDIIQVEFISLAPLIYILPEKAVKILVHHEIRFMRLLREMDIFKSKDAFDTCRFETIKDQEISLLKKFDKIITLTETDKSILEKYLVPDNIFASQAGIPFEHSQNNAFIPFKSRLVFIGSSSHLPNIDGLDWFISSVLPELQSRIPGIHLDVIGKWSKQLVKKYSRINIHFTGFVEDLQTVFKGSLLIVPIRIGSGMRLKIIDAVNYSIPFVSTSIGVEGLDFRNKTECLIADEPIAFAEAIFSLAENPEYQAKLVKGASKKMEKGFSFETLLEKRLNIYEL